LRFAGDASCIWAIRTLAWFKTELSMCNDSQLVCIFVAPKVISNVPQAGQNTTRQSALSARLTFLCCLFEFIDFTIQMLGRMESAEATVCSVSLTLAGCQQLKVLDDGWLFFYKLFGQD